MFRTELREAAKRFYHENETKDNYWTAIDGTMLNANFYYVDNKVEVELFQMSEYATHYETDYHRWVAVPEHRFAEMCEACAEDNHDRCRATDFCIDGDKCEDFTPVCACRDQDCKEMRVVQFA